MPSSSPAWRWLSLPSPPGLPAVVTTMYSMGTRELAAQNAIVKTAAIGGDTAVSAICTDKTGTLTLNKMTAREFTVPGQNRYHVTGEGYGSTGELQLAKGIPAGQPWQKSATPYSTEGQDTKRRRDQDRPGSGYAAHGPVRRRPAGRRSADRLTHRGRADSVG